MVFNTLKCDALGTLENKAEDALKALTGKNIPVNLNSDKYDKYAGVTSSSSASVYSYTSSGSGTQYTGTTSSGNYSTSGPSHWSMQPDSYGTASQQMPFQSQSQSPFPPVPGDFMPHVPAHSFGSSPANSFVSPSHNASGYQSSGYDPIVQQAPCPPTGQNLQGAYGAPPGQSPQFAHGASPYQQPQWCANPQQTQESQWGQQGQQGQQWQQWQQWQQSQQGQVYHEQPPPPLIAGYEAPAPSYQQPANSYNQGVYNGQGMGPPSNSYTGDQMPPSGPTPIGQWNTNGPNSWGALNQGR